MPTVTIDGQEMMTEPGTSILQACEQLGIEIPRFCYHERLSIAANCRMCLVELERSPKPIASCTMPCGEGMVIYTNSPKVHAARRGVMEFLLINHPLDCPICDQGGECDLQDQAMAYGFDHSRYQEPKRAVTNKDLGPLIKTAMTRCIHCTRCIRFCDEIAGVSQLGATGRGESTTITNYLEQAITNELSGNLTDICPVGALTSKPYSFIARPWELTKTESIDVFDAVGSNIRIDTRGIEVMRTLPRFSEEINEEWISDKTRFAYDGLKRQRLDRPYVRREGRLQEASWTEAFDVIAKRIENVPGSKIAALAGDLCDAESMIALKDLMTTLQSPNLDCRQEGGQYDTNVRSSYLFNSTILGIEQADVILLIGTDPRREAALINARIRKRFLMGGVTIGLIGPEVDLTYPYHHLGTDPHTLTALAKEDHPFCEILKQARCPMMIVGIATLARPDGPAIQYLLYHIAQSLNLIRDDWNGFNVLHTAAARVAGLDLAFLPGEQGLDTLSIYDQAERGNIEIVYLLGADEIDTTKLGKGFVIYQGHHGDRGAHRADVILPGAAYSEKHGTYVNTEGRPQRGKRALFPPGNAREDWTIIRALAERLGCSLNYDDLSGIRRRLGDVNSIFKHSDQVKPSQWSPFGRPGPIDSMPFLSPIENFYMTDSISRASETMAKCSQMSFPLSTRNIPFSSSTG